MSPAFDPAAKEAARRLAVELQRQAIEPGTSAWVQASAGTGKTKVLVDRVLALLLAGAAPGRILCLTFTKAAAAEMANRLSEQLGQWATAEETLLAGRLKGLLPPGQEPDAALLAHARSLFARVLDVPGGMKIQTIHAFCQSVLGRFPLEAGVAPHFKVMDERSAAELLFSAREESVAGAVAGNGASENETVGKALSVIAEHAHESTFGELLGDLLRERGRLLRDLELLGGIEGLRRQLRRRLGLRQGEARGTLLAEGCADAALDLIGLRLALQTLEAGSKTDQDKAQVIAAWLADPAGRVEGLQAYLNAFFTAGGEGARRAKLLTKKALEADPHAGEVLLQECDRLEALRGRLRALTVVEKTAALVEIGAAVIRAYERHKAARALLDYDDLILRTGDLLTSAPGRAAWVLFKLDGGLDHVLIDEAQDTNPAQWRVIEALTSEFFVGEGREPGPASSGGSGSFLRSLFAVGDAKQSIYSFQGADPRGFAAMRDLFARKASDARMPLRDVSLAVSFRSTGALLMAVDRVFAREEARRGLFLGPEPLEHRPERVGQAGLVEIWPPVDPVPGEDRGPWDPPEPGPGPASETGSGSDAEQLPARSRLARLIARRIWHWTQDPAGADDPASRLESKGRRLQPGDFLVLVRRRDAFVEALVRELKVLGVPVAGVDRMVLTEQLAVMDLIALGQVLLLPEDDLTLATVLKGPLIGLDEEQLFQLARGDREGGREGSLWRALVRKARAEEGIFRRAWERLSALLARADFIRPFELYGELLGAAGGREALVRRLGVEANDPIDEFLSLTLAYEREHVPSLQGFLHWIEAGGQEVKRDLEQGADAVRVMTVHGAKGLQAPVVFLPDTLQVQPQERGLLWLDSAPPDETRPPLWPLKSAYDGPSEAAARGAVQQQREEEYRRLLYVAMTRAEDRLYVCGYGTRKAPPADCWYHLVRDGLAETAESLAFDFTGEIEGGWSGQGWRLAEPQLAPPEGRPCAPAPVMPDLELPPWAREPAPPEPSPPRPLAPSRPALPEPPGASPVESGGQAALNRGLLIHRLLQHLPDLPPERRAASGRRMIGRAGSNPTLDPTRDSAQKLGEAEQAAILAAVLAVLEAPESAPLYGPQSRAEVPVIGLVKGREGPFVVSGRVDRLAVTGSEVLLVDYKTNREPPVDESAVPLAYVRQMATYRAVLQEIFPDRPIRCLLLWTVGPRVMQISDALLDLHAP